eukprot:scaffold71263_cov65-Phaeocystis_antarctica.AAC.3
MDPPSSTGVRDAGSGMQRLRDRIMPRTHPLSVTYWPPRCFTCIMVKGISAHRRRWCVEQTSPTPPIQRAAPTSGADAPADGATAAGYQCLRPRAALTCPPHTATHKRYNGDAVAKRSGLCRRRLADSALDDAGQPYDVGGGDVASAALRISGTRQPPTRGMQRGGAGSLAGGAGGSRRRRRGWCRERVGG